MRPRPLRYALGRWVEPADAFVALFAGQTDVAWLDTGGASAHGRSYLASGSRVVSASTQVPSVLEFLREDVEQNRTDPVPDGGFGLGWIGWLGYETRSETMDATPDPTAESAFLFADRALEFDHASREVFLVALGDSWTGELLMWRRDVIATLGDVAGVASAMRAVRTGEQEATTPVRASWRDTDSEYLEMIRDCQAAIVRGDAYLLCLTTSVSVDVHPDPVRSYLALRHASPSHHGALIRIGETALLSSSPEQFITVTPDGSIESRPIKGTRPRGATAALDAALADELLTSEKERAENLMIVDLMRNDIGRVSKIGSVEVPGLNAVESYAQVHQLVSTVRGRLADGLTGFDAVLACFPAGSMTGTPKWSAVRILNELERHPRGVYSGAFGYFGLDGRIDLAMVIRSILITPRGATIGSGGGITVLSDPDEELAEVKLKVAALLNALGAS